MALSSTDTGRLGLARGQHPAHNLEFRDLPRRRRGRTRARLRDRVAREFTPKGKVVWEVNLPNMPFTAIRLGNGNTVIGCTRGNMVIEVDSNGKTVWQLTNDDLRGGPIHDACGIEPLPNGNTVIAGSELAMVRSNCWRSHGRRNWSGSIATPKDQRPTGPSGSVLGREAALHAEKQSNRDASGANSFRPQWIELSFEKSGRSREDRGRNISCTTESWRYVPDRVTRIM